MKNLEPTAEMVGMALTEAQIAAKIKQTQVVRNPMVFQLFGSEIRVWMILDNLKVNVLSKPEMKAKE